MKWIKKELEKIPLEPYPKKLTKRANHLLVMSAQLRNYHEEQILIATFYTIADKAPFCRAFLAKHTCITQLFTCGGGWTQKSIDVLKPPSEAWGTIDSIAITLVADAKTKNTVDCFIPSKQHWVKEPLAKIRRRQNDIRYERSVKASEKRAGTDSEIMNTVFNRLPPLPTDMEQQILDGPLSDSRFMFYRSGKKRDPLTGIQEKAYFGYCSHCKKEYELDWIPTHKETEYRCPGCASLVTTYARGISRKRLKDRCNYMVWCIKGEEIFARMFEIERDYSGEPEKIHTCMEESERFYFAPGAAYKFTRYEVYGMGTKYLSGYWHKQGQVSEDIYDYYIYPHPKDIFIGTCVEHSHLDDYLRLCRTQNWSTKPMQYLACFVQTPSIEHLLDSGLYTLLRERVTHTGKAYKTINWKKQRPRDMLGVSQPELEQIKRYNMSGSEIYVYKKLKDSGVGLDEHGFAIIRFLSEKNYVNEDDKLKKFERLGCRKMLRYLDYQQRKAYQGKAGYPTIWSEFEDYHRMCSKLGYDLSNEYYLFPPNLKKAHDSAARLVTEQEEIKLQKRYAQEQAEWDERYKALKDLTFSDGTLLIRPVKSRAELITEGKLLQHCVASYAESVRQGKTCIFLIRRAEQPDEPYYTLNTTPPPGCKFIQCHGFKNDSNLPKGDRPQAIKDFEAKWYANAVKPWQKKCEREKIKALQSTAKNQPCERVRAVG
ncbi:MAG: PcfJ domain-containing protein [Acetanaerobacterium sp.]